MKIKNLDNEIECNILIYTTIHDIHTIMITNPASKSVLNGGKTMKIIMSAITCLMLLLTGLTSFAQTNCNPYLHAKYGPEEGENGYCPEKEYIFRLAPPGSSNCNPYYITDYTWSITGGELSVISDSPGGEAARVIWEEELVFEPFIGVVAIGSSGEYNAILNVSMISHLTPVDPLALTIKISGGSTPVSMGICDSETYDFETTQITEIVTSSVNDLKYYWSYNNGSGWNSLETSKINKKTGVSLANRGLDPSKKIQFKVEAWSVCSSNKKTSLASPELPLKYCFGDLPTNVTNPTCHDSTNSTITINNIPNPATCATYAASTDPNKNKMVVTIARYVEAPVGGCSNSGGTGGFTDIENINGTDYCLSGTSINVPFDWTSSQKILRKNDITINPYPPGPPIEGIREGVYQIQIENVLFSPHKFFTENPITAPNRLDFKSASGIEKDTPYHLTTPGATNGEISVKVTGGTPPWDIYYKLSSASSYTTDSLGSEANDPALDNIFTVGNFSEGHYDIKIRDINDCQDNLGIEKEDTFSIFEPEPLSVNNIIALPNICNTNDDNFTPTGLISLKGLGGIGAYAGELRYLNEDYYKDITWAGSDGTIDNVASGTYKVYIEDNDGTSPYQQKTIADTIPVGEPQELAMTASNPVPPKCIGGSNGEITITAGGSESPYIFSFDGAEEFPLKPTSKTYKGFFSGNHTVVVKNNNGCIKTNTNVNIPPNPNAIKIKSVEPIKVECYGDSTGEIEVFAEKGDTILDHHFYLIDGISNYFLPDTIASAKGNPALFNGLPKGTYSVFVQDDNNCLIENNPNYSYREIVLDLPQNDLISFDTTITHVAAKGDNTGIIEARLSAGAEKYNYALVFNEDTSTINTSNGEIRIDTLSVGLYTLLVRDTCGCTNTIGNEWWAHKINITEPEFALGLVTDGLTHIKCYGNTTGEINVHGTGGWGDFTYNLYDNIGNPVETGNTSGSFNKLPAGIYEIEVFDRMNASYSIHDTLTQSDNPLQLTSAEVDSVKCFSETTGKATLHLTGGTEPYYSSLNKADVIWSEDTIISGLDVGTAVLSKDYRIYYRDGNECTDSVNVTLHQYPYIVIDTIFKTTAQAGVNNGAMQVVVSGGKNPYSYLWNGEGFTSTDETFTGIKGGVYDLTITDSYSCEHHEDSILLENKPGPELIDIAYQKPSCYGWNNGYIGFTPIHGNPTYNIDLLLNGLLFDNRPNADSAFVDTFKNLTAGDYELWITDSWNWKRNPPVTYSMPLDSVKKVSLNHMLVTHITKTGDTDGKIQFKISGGNHRYEYILDSAGTTIQSNTINGIDSVLNLQKGFYTLFYRDTCGCTNDLGDWIVLDSIEIIEPKPLSFAIDTIQQPRCNGEINGLITVKGTGGWRPKNGYDYRISSVTSDSWAPDSIFSGLKVGKYYIEVRDEKNVVFGDSIEVTEPDVFELSDTLAITHVNCYNESNGAISLKLQGGTLPYIVHITNQDTIYNQNYKLPGLTEGVYTIDLKDIRGCSIPVFSDTITQPDNLLDTVWSIEAQDTLSNGALFVDITGSVSPYDVIWLNALGDTISEAYSVLQTDSVLNIPFGDYSISITDQHGCNNYHPVYLPKKGGPKTYSLIRNDISCTSYANGTLDFQMIEGHPPYRLWFINQNNDTITSFENVRDSVFYRIANIEPGLYTLSIQDNRGWVSKEFYTLTEPGQILVHKKITDVPITGQNTGRVDFTITGGSLNYEYQFKHIISDNIIFEGKSTGAILVTGLYAGQYALYLKDTTGCTNGSTDWLIMDDIEISQPKTLGLQLTKLKHPECNGDNNGGIHVTGVDGFSDNYMYWINNEDSTYYGIFSQLTAGDYLIKVRDEAGATYSESFTLNEPGVLDFEVLVSNDVCDPEKIPSADLTINGGTLPYYNSLNNIFWDKGTHIPELEYGNNTIYVKDTNNCTTTPKDILIEQAEPLVVNFTIQEAQYGENNGSIQAMVSGGVAPYNIKWYDDANNLLPGQTLLDTIGTGTYRFELTGQDSCTVSQQVILAAKYGPRLNQALTVPVSCLGKTNGQASFTLKDGNGKYKVEVFKNEILLHSFTSIGINDTCKMIDLEAGEYSILIKDSLLWKGTGSFTISSPETIQITVVNIQDLTCYGYSDAFIEVSARGSNGGYSYSWSNGEPGKNISNLPSGTYSVTVTDNLGCMGIKETVINDPQPLTVELGNDETICQGQILTLAPGVFKTYSWKFNGDILSNAPQITINKQGQYTLLVESNQGCFAADTFKLTTSTDLLEAEFLMPSEAFVNDTVVIIDITWPEPEEIFWDFDQRIVRINSETYMEEIAFNSPGVYDVKLTSVMAICIDSVSKQITVKEIPGENPDNLKPGAEESIVKKFIIYPNPNTGQFTADIELSEKTDIELRIFNIQQNSFILIEKYYNADKYLLDIGLTNISSGIYLVVLQVKNEKKTKRILIAK